MNADTIACFNYVLHSLVIGAVAWLLVRFVIRDALRRCILGNLAVLMCLYTPFNIGMQDLLPTPKEEVPVWTPIRETLKADWRVSVAPVSAPEVNVVSQERRWDVNEVVRGMRWLAWGVAGLVLLRLLVQSVGVQRWVWGLRRMTCEEEGLLSERVLGCSNAREIRAGMETLESSRGVEHSRTLARVRVFDGASTPCVAGWFFPVIAVPASAFEKLTARQWGWLLRHEAEHLRLHDTVAGLLQNIVRAFLWWNPFLHALVEEYAQAREVMCDDAAVGGEREHGAYADFLLECAASPGPQQACVMPIAYSRPARRLKARLVALMEARGVRKKVGALFVLALVAFAILAPVIVASFGIATVAAQEAVKADKDDGAMRTRAYKVAPDFLNGETVLADPFVPGKTAPGPAPRNTARQLLEKKGVSFPPGASASYNPATSQLIVRNTKSNLEVVERAIDILNQRPMMVYVTCKLIQADEFLGAHESVLSSEDAQALIGNVTQMKGVDLLTSPSTTTRFDQNATIEAVREVLPKTLPDSKRGGDRKFVGVSIELLAHSPAQGKSVIEATASLGIDPEANDLWLPKGKSSADWDKVQIHRVSAKTAMASGETLLLHLPTSKRPVTVLITAAALDPSGGKADSFSATMRVAPLASQGRELPEEEIRDSRKGSAMATRVYRVAADFGDGKKPVEYLQSKGVVFPQGASAQLADGRLTVRNTNDNLDLIEELIDSLTDATHNKSVRVSVQAVEMKGDFLELVKEWVPPQPMDPKVAENLAPVLDAAKPALEFLPLYTTAAILAPAQFKTVVKKIADANVKIEVLGLDGKSKKYKLPGVMGGLEVEVESRVGGDGNTIELIVTCNEKGDKVSGAKHISTGVSIWGGQTFVLAAQPTEGVSRFLFITGDIEEAEKKK